MAGAYRVLSYPLGEPVIEDAAVRRVRALPTGARILVQPGAVLRADTVLAEATPGVPILAGLAGRVGDVAPGSVTIEGHASIIHATMGLGGPAAGVLSMLPHGDDPAFPSIARGSVIVYPGRLPLMLVQRAAAAGAAGIIAGSMAPIELEAFARTDLTSLFDGLVPDPLGFPLALICTEGPGDLPMEPDLLQLISRALGQTVLLSGTTRPRANLHPELLLPARGVGRSGPLPAPSILQVGARVRVSAGRARGTRGEIVYLPAHMHPSEAGLALPVADVRLADGRVVRCPLPLLDRLEQLS